MKAKTQEHGVPFVCGMMCMHTHLHLWEVNAIADRCIEGSVHVYVQDENTYTQICIYIYIYHICKHRKMHMYTNMRNGCVHTWGHEGTYMCMAMSILYG